MGRETAPAPTAGERRVYRSGKKMPCLHPGCGGDGSASGRSLRPAPRVPASASIRQGSLCSLARLFCPIFRAPGHAYLVAMIEIQSSMPVSSAATPLDKPKRDVFRAMWRGARGRCPSCGQGRLFERYLKVADNCPHCGEALHHQRADDAPPYFTIFVVGHVILPLMLAFEAAFRPEAWVHVLLWGPLTIGLSLLLLPMIKGAVVGLQWANYMHGFDPEAEESALGPLPKVA